MFLTQLKQATQHDHQSIEAQVDLHSQLGSLADYRRLLERFWGFYTPIEQRLAYSQDWASYGVDIQQRMKAPALARDLQALGLSAAALAGLPLCQVLPALDSVPRRLGCLYVLEGATLGGQIIAREARGRLGQTPERGCQFFTSYGEQVGAMWRSFQLVLVRVAVDEAAQADVIRGAHETFEAFGRWLACGVNANDHDR